MMQSQRQVLYAEQRVAVPDTPRTITINATGTSSAEVAYTSMSQHFQDTTTVLIFSLLVMPLRPVLPSLVGLFCNAATQW
jgi:hypothetical protein